MIPSHFGSRVPLQVVLSFVLLAGGAGCGTESIAPEEELVTYEFALSCGGVRPGEQLKPGEAVESCGGRTLLVMQGDGNLVAYFKPSMTPLWASHTFEAGSWAVMQGDGNFVVYSGGGKAMWSTITHGKPGAHLAVQDDGNVVIYAGEGGALWATHAMPVHAPCGLDAARHLDIGQSILSCNQKFGLHMQGDGNLVVYGADGKAVWASGTRAEEGSAKRGHFAAMQADGNFVIYNSQHQPVWHTSTNDHPLSALFLNDDGTLSIIGRDRQVLWTTATGGGGEVEVPSSLVSSLSAKPYVEQSCVSATYPGWPHPAKRCTYSSGGITTSVTVANPSPEQVGRSIVDSVRYIPELAKLKGKDQARYEEGLRAIGLAMLYQSSRIFPLSGGVIENMGSGYVNYIFEKGVTKSCSSGCYCRINSLHRRDWCEFQAAIGAQSQSACLAGVGSSGYTTGWSNQCLENHKRAWTSSVNDHFRAKAFKANQVVASRCPSGACSASQVVAAVKSGYGL